ncbi:MAG: OmpA family protein, partial [Bacteroidota bacterium]
LPAEESALASIYFDDPWLSVSVRTQDVVSLQITESIYYDYGKWELLPSAGIILNKVVDVMTKNTGIVIEIISHTDSRGTNEFNLSLSQKRAQAAVDYVLSKGIAKEKISGKGMGEKQLVNRCKDGTECSEEEHSQNRRTEFIIKNQ